MKAKILIVEDQFIEAANLERILERAGYQVCPVARSVATALEIINNERPDMVLLDIFLQGKLTGIDLAKSLNTKNIAFVFISANLHKQTLDDAKLTKPYGFLVKPFREKDVLLMLDVAWYLHQERMEIIKMKNVPSKTPPDLLKGKELMILGRSQQMHDVLENIRIVAPSNTSVLVLGESGTGKELIAERIHSLSERCAKPMVIVNCATLPSNLIESELFGHEKGAFTGAMNRRIGKFEEADEGTIFLDEIGELPPDLQVKFLRVLQSKTIERIGGQTKKINVRIIAATNRNLEEEIAAGRFRMDLYYRLNVFPILLPPLRDRKEDILLLSTHFINLFAQRSGKSITGFADDITKKMLSYSWPGNVRELENLMERSVLLAKGTLINSLILPENFKKLVNIHDKEKVKTIEEIERDHILMVLEKCGWKVSGRGGAAEILRIKVSTLNSKIKKLGIYRDKAITT
ncbi:sigma-54-dependent transcriptional regulator [Mucilaginibacter sp. McL0603]|uniref:sigma-54-dependent transcriptional regulator n=1 Tax=Mucilaginibacter sp. McL0603 TaxID=3415670 RepID=UPI003CF154F7